MSQESSNLAAEVGAQEKTGIQQGLADRAEALHGIAQIRENLGHVAARPIVTARGEVLTPSDRQEELRVRAEQGHSYQR